MVPCVSSRFTRNKTKRNTIRFLLFSAFHQSDFIWGRGDVGVFALRMSYQPVHLVCLFDPNGVAQAEGSQEQLLSALGMEKRPMTSSVPCMPSPLSSW